MANAKLNTVGAVTNDSQSLGGSAPAINFALQRSIPISAAKCQQKNRFARKHPPTLRPRGVFMGVYASALAEETAQQLQQGSAVEIAEHNAVPPMYISLARTTSL